MGHHGQSFGWATRLAAIALGGAVLMASSTGAWAQKGGFEDFELKAGYFFNFPKFIDWPPAALPGGSPFVVGIVGEGPVCNAIERVVRGQVVSGHKISVRRGRGTDELKSCHMVFISSSEGDRAGEIVRGLQGASVLTVGDGAGFTRQGGMIGFLRDGDRVRFQINDGAARAAGITIRAKLRKLIPD